MRPIGWFGYPAGHHYIPKSRTQIAPIAKASEAASDNAYAQSIPAMAEIVG